MKRKKNRNAKTNVNLESSSEIFPVSKENVCESSPKNCQSRADKRSKS
ncbi:MAG: hypothetical protein ACOX7R_02895 [Acetivibrionales bacterium]|jgi:hypothetical protein